MTDPGLLKGKRILVVDDDRNIRKLLREELEGSRYTIVEAKDGFDAVEQIRYRRPDLIILDIMMRKGAEGFIFARKIRKDPRFARIPILMLTSMREQTGFDFSGERIHPQFLPVDEYVEKPLDPEALPEKVEKVLSRNRDVGSLTAGA